MNDAKRRNIVLGGFMGTGKTTVGQLVADYLRWHFVDADAEIVAKVGLSIPEICQQQGEEGFRRYEMIVAQLLAARQGCVIATGGGMLVNPANLSLMQASGFVVCLTADPDEIERRLQAEDGRPLVTQWRELLAARRAAYANIPTQVDTTNKSPEDVAQEIIRLWQRQSR